MAVLLAAGRAGGASRGEGALLRAGGDVLRLAAGWLLPDDALALAAASRACRDGLLGRECVSAGRPGAADAASASRSVARSVGFGPLRAEAVLGAALLAWGAAIANAAGPCRDCLLQRDSIPIWHTGDEHRAARRCRLCSSLAEACGALALCGGSSAVKAVHLAGFLGGALRGDPPDAARNEVLLAMHERRLGPRSRWAQGYWQHHGPVLRGWTLARVRACRARLAGPMHGALQRLRERAKPTLVERVLHACAILLLLLMIIRLKDDWRIVANLRGL